MLNTPVFFYFHWPPQLSFGLTAPRVKQEVQSEEVTELESP